MQRKRYPDVPTFAKIEWLFNSAQAQAFQGWCRDAIADCSAWFDCPLRTPLGYNLHTVRFTDIYDGPREAGRDLWKFSGELEFLNRPLVPVGEGLFPDDIVNSKLLDLTINRELPTV
jgi:hypothetical protein